jgi:hypothetical protein
MNLAVHVSASCELWRPLRTGIEEAWQIFLTRHSGRGVKQSEQPACTVVGPLGV